MTFAKFNKKLPSPPAKPGKPKPAIGTKLLLSTMDSNKPPIKLSKRLNKKLKKFFLSRLFKAFNKKGKRVTTLKLTGEDLRDFEASFFGSSKDLATLKNAISSIDEIMLSGDTIVTSPCHDYATTSPIGILTPMDSSTSSQLTLAESVTARTTPRNKFTLWVFNEDGMEGRVALTAGTHLEAYSDERAAIFRTNKFTQLEDAAKIELSIIDTPCEELKTLDDCSTPKVTDSPTLEATDQDQLEISLDQPETPQDQPETPQDQIETPKDQPETLQDRLHNPQHHLETTTTDTRPQELEANDQDAVDQDDSNNTDSTPTDTSDELATATPTTASTNSETGTCDDNSKPKDLDERANDYKMINKIYDNIVLCIDTNTTWKYIEPAAPVPQIRDEVEPGATASPGQAGILVFQAPTNLKYRAKYSAKPLAAKTYIKSRTIRTEDNDTNFTSRPFHLHAHNEKVRGINILSSSAFT